MPGLAASTSTTTHCPSTRDPPSFLAQLLTSRPARSWFLVPAFQLTASGHSGTWGDSAALTRGDTVTPETRLCG